MSDSCDSMDCIAPGSSVHVCYWNQLRFLKQRSLSGSRQKGSLSSCVAGDVFIWVICLEVNASLKWMPWQSKLKSDICFKKKKRQKPKKKKKSSGLTLQWCFHIDKHFHIHTLYLLLEYLMILNTMSHYNRHYLSLPTSDSPLLS